jgi:GntR family transcriptional regulator
MLDNCTLSAYSSLVPETSIQITSGSPTPIYRQIVDQIRTHIDSGAISPGDALPSIRSLATQLGVHFNTVAEAYRDLAQEGSIDLNQGKRALVRSFHSFPQLVPAEVETLRQRLRNLVAEMRLKGIPTSIITSEVNTILGR